MNIIWVVGVGQKLEKEGEGGWLATEREVMVYIGSLCEPRMRTISQ